eukprot:scaffold15051_cov144-Amphora_coffeaeformis.AAC.3
MMMAIRNSKSIFFLATVTTLLSATVLAFTFITHHPRAPRRRRRHHVATRLYGKKTKENVNPAGEGYPRVYSWHKNGTVEEVVVSSKGTPAMQPPPPPPQQQQQLPPAAQETWNWCRHFVVPHNLCPWAAASVQATGAVAIYLIDSQRDGINTFAEAIPDVADLFWESINPHHASVQGDDTTRTTYDAHTAISFVTDISGEWQDFDSFNEYYEGLLDDFMESNDKVMLAPFHPAWHYAGLDGQDALHLEKQSPYPTISIVAQHVLDQAGSQASERIAQHNEEVLHNAWGYAAWKSIYQQALQGKQHHTAAMDDNDDDDDDAGVWQ